MANSSEGRITHALSHHLYTNSYNDFEIFGFNPLLEFLPDPKISFANKYISPVLCQCIFLMAFPAELLRKIMGWCKGLATFNPLEDLLPLSELLILWTLSDFGLVTSFYYWMYIQSIAGWWIFPAVLTTHHHNSIYHAGDFPCPSKDWGIR